LCHRDLAFPLRGERAHPDKVLFFSKFWNSERVANLVIELPEEYAGDDGDIGDIAGSRNYSTIFLSDMRDRRDSHRRICFLGKSCR
jgi:hypothetical protein